MMSSLFLQAVSLSLSASIVTALVLLLRALLKKAPRAISCALWVLVGLRLILPSLPESRVSVIPEELSGGAAVNELQRQVVEETVTVREDVDPALYRQITVQYKELPVYRDDGHNYVVVSAAPAHTPPKTFGESVVPVLTVIWIAGAGLMLLYMAGSYVAIRRRLRTAVRMEDGVWESDEVTSPFILGFVRPRIYLPTSLSKEEAAFVLAHERTHIRRGDQIWKPLSFLLLSVYWFNPVFWLAYYLLCRDIEAACDEKVIREQNAAYRKAYSETLLALNIRERTVSACPLAFAENGVKERIKNILSYRKPAFWLIVTALAVSIAAAGCALTDPAEKSTERGSAEAAQQKLEEYYRTLPGEDGRRIYEDDFGGAYLEGGKLILCLKEPDEETKERYLGITGNRDFVEIKAVSRSWNELFHMGVAMAGEFLQNGVFYSAPTMYVDVENNGLFFKTTKEYEEIVRSALKEKYPDVPSRVEIVEPSNIPIPRSGRYSLTGAKYDGSEYLEFDFEKKLFHFRAKGENSGRSEFYGNLDFTEKVFGVDLRYLYAYDYSAQVLFYFRMLDEQTILFDADGSTESLVMNKKRLEHLDRLSWQEALPASDEPEPSSETDPAESTPGGDQAGTAFINPDSVTGTYTFSEGVIRDYIGEWGDERYFVLQMVRPGHPDMDGMYRYAVGHVRKDAEDGDIQILADLDCDYYQNVSKMINGTAYIATDKGIFAVTPEGTVTEFIGGKDRFAVYPTAGNMFLYSYSLQGEQGGQQYLEAYYFWPAETIRYLTLEGDASGSESAHSLLTASALQDGVYYVLSHGDTNEVWYQPRTAQDAGAGISREAVLLEKNKIVSPQYVAGNEQFYVLVYGAGEPTIHLVFRDEPATSKEVKTGAWGYTPLQAVLARNGSWRFTSQQMWFDIDVETRTCSLYNTALFDETEGWNYFGRTDFSREIIMLSSDCHSMLLAQDETEAVDYAATPLTDFRLACGTSESKDKAEERGLSAELKEAGGLPIFRLDSEEDLLLFSKIFDEPAPNYGKIGLKQALQTYDSEFFGEKVLFAVYGSFGPSSLEEEYFRVGSLLRNNVLHLRLGVVVPLGTWMTADLVYSWILVPVERSDVRDVTAYDATLAVRELPPDWTESVNPDWRKQ